MKKQKKAYPIRIEETYSRVVSVVATSMEEAQTIAANEYKCGAYPIGDDGLDTTTFTLAYAATPRRKDSLMIMNPQKLNA